MSIIAFWNEGKEQSGKTLTSVAVATNMAIEYNYKILLVSTSYKDSTMKNCFWMDNASNNAKLFSRKNNIAVENGMEGLAKLIKSNKIQPSIITDYTKVIFKDRLEVLGGYVGAIDKTDDENLADYRENAECYVELIKLANQFYDIVIVDVDNKLDKKVKKEILDTANLNIIVLSQRLTYLNKYNSMKASTKPSLKNMIAIGKYDANSKYTKKNITRFLEERREVNAVPYNTLFFEAAEEAGVTELFLKLRNIKDTRDENYIFMSEIKKFTDNIIVRLQELQMKMR